MFLASTSGKSTFVPVAILRAYIWNC